MKAIRLIGVALLISLSGCYWYKPELPTNKCDVNDQCPNGEWCGKEHRCVDIHFPE